MSSPVVTVTPETSFKAAVQLMRSKRVSGLPVVDPKGCLVGIVTEGDLLNKVEQRNPDSYVQEARRHRLDRARASALDVSSAMSTEVTTVGPDCPIALAAREMHTHGFKRLPVVDARGDLVGIVSRGDLLTVFLRSDAKVRADVRRTLRAAEAHHGGRGLTGTVTSGVVVLSGTFDERSRLEATVRAVTAIDGVVGVRSQMTYALDDTLVPS
jgi:CBS domain-containing protein